MYEFKQIDYNEAVEFLLPRHYSGRKPSITVAYGAFDNQGVLKAVCTYGKPASNSLCEGVCGKEFKSKVFELNRLCREDDYEEPISRFVAYTLHNLRERDWVVVSYSDTAMNHYGFVYQSCNFLYTGATKQRTDKYTKDNKHSRHYSNSEQKGGKEKLEVLNIDMCTSALVQRKLERCMKRV